MAINQEVLDRLRAQNASRTAASAEQMAALMNSMDPEVQSRMASAQAKIEAMQRAQLEPYIPTAESKIAAVLTRQTDGTCQIWTLGPVEFDNQTEQIAGDMVFSGMVTEELGKGETNFIRVVTDPEGKAQIVIRYGEKGDEKLGSVGVEKDEFPTYTEVVDFLKQKDEERAQQQ